MNKILIVDDSSTVRDEVVGYFTKNGVTAISATDGLAGFKAVANDSDIKLILSDVNMPNMDGLTMVEKIRSELKSDVVVIMLTTESSASMKDRGKASGVKGWIVKPFKGDAVLPTVKKILGL